MDAKGRLQPVDPQPPLRLADEHYGDPARSSLRFESDTAIHKPYVDVVINGRAHSPAGRRVGEVMVELQAADIRKRLVVRGDRRRLILGIASSPEPFVAMPIVYERAYGGCETRTRNPGRNQLHPFNPVGVGFRGVCSADASVKTDFPNVEYAGSRSHTARKSPAGFGAIARAWSPRRELGGTYNSAWLATQWPLPPHDFDERYYQAAPPDQQSRTVRGGTEFRLVNLTEDGEWRFQLPDVTLPVRLFYDNRRRDEVRLRTDTVWIGPDDRLLFLSQRLALRQPRTRPPLREIVLGDVTRGWLRARETGKRYLGSEDEAGRSAGVRSS
jgi:hypothetical protein